MKDCARPGAREKSFEANKKIENSRSEPFARLVAVLVAVIVWGIGFGFLVLIGGVALAQPGPSRTYFGETLMPLKKGAVWVYRGSAEVAGADSPSGGPKILRSRVVLRQKVKEVFNYQIPARHLRIVAALMEGHPQDLWFYEPGRQPCSYMLVEVDSNKVGKLAKLYMIDGEAVNKIKNLIEAGKDPSCQLTEADLIFQLPVQKNSCFGNADKKQWPMFAWSVEKIERADLSKVKKGLHSAGAHASCYRLIYRANTDHSQVGFVPGLGYLDYSGEHHGTLANFDVQLEEFYCP